MATSVPMIIEIEKKEVYCKAACQKSTNVVNRHNWRCLLKITHNAILFADFLSFILFEHIAITVESCTVGYLKLFSINISLKNGIFF